MLKHRRYSDTSGRLQEVFRHLKSVGIPPANHLQKVFRLLEYLLQIFCVNMQVSKYLLTWTGVSVGISTEGVGIPPTRQHDIYMPDCWNIY